MYCQACLEKEKLPIPEFCDYSFCQCDDWEEKDYWDDLWCYSCSEEKNVCQRCGENIK